ncbi:MAG TPA: DUF4350 domain-containing protein [Steroidobacteraceae bacterium]|nr:DUF4350 domain-containing protein [Steroidobacteraceae bacterium]
MRERLVTLGCALGALLLFVTLFLHGASVARPETSMPTTAERGDNGLLGALSWLRQEQVRTLSLRRRFDTLGARRDLAPRGNLLIVTLPAATPLRPRELRSLDEWLREGNTLLVLAAIADKPDWAAGRAFHTELNDLTGLGYDSVRLRTARSAPPGEGTADLPGLAALAAGAYRRLAPPERTTLIPNRAHAYLEGVRSAVALSDYPWRTFPWEAWTVTVPHAGFVLSLASQRETGEGVLWVRTRGAGTIVVSGFSSLFSNRALGLADNARLLANIVGASVAPGGAVLFDDEHQGLSDNYDPARFYRDPRLYATLAVLAALWLTWVLGGTRLRARQSRAPAPREAELVQATGVFLARVLAPAAAARRMFEHFFAHLRTRVHGPPGGAPPWELLESQPRLARADLEQLRTWYAAAYSGGRVPLVRLHNLMLRMERQLAA